VPTTNFDRKKVLGEIFWPFGGTFGLCSGDKNRDNSSSKKSNRDRRQKADSFTKKCPYAFCFFSKIVDNILWGGASFEIREFFCRVDKITDLYSTIYSPVTGGKKI